MTLTLSRTCTVIQRVSAGAGRYGGETPEEVTFATVCELQQRQASEAPDEAEVSDDAWLVVLPPGTELSTGDAVEVDGEVFEIVGDPWHVVHPWTRTEHHVEVRARRTAGARDGS